MRVEGYLFQTGLKKIYVIYLNTRLFFILIQYNLYNPFYYTYGIGLIQTQSKIDRIGV